MEDPQVVSRAEWLTARKAFLTKEKEFTRQRDALNAERRGLPMTEVDKEYVFDGPNGAVSLPDPFEARPHRSRSAGGLGAAAGTQ